MTTHASKPRYGRPRCAAIATALAIAGFVVLGQGLGCATSPTPSPTPTPAQVTDPTVLATLVQGQAGSLVIRCTTDAAALSVAADLSDLGGPAAQALARGEGSTWTWSGLVTPPSVGEVEVNLTATGAGEPGTGHVSVEVSAADPSRLVIDLGDAIVIELVAIPAGTFSMGTASTDVVAYYQLGVTEPVSSSDWSNAARPVHAVTIGEPFFMGKYPVTQAQWEAVMGENPSGNRGDANRPVDNVSWNDAVAFCTALSERAGRTIRLPSEAEWEYACKAGGGDTGYSFGDEAGELERYGWYVDNSASGSHPVGEKLPSAFGLYDMHGNVWEWCQDFSHDTYLDAPADGSVWNVGGNGALRVLRGGSYSQTFGACRSAWRNFFPPTEHYADFGFRLVAP